MVVPVEMAVLEGLLAVESLMGDGKRKVVGATSHGFLGKMNLFMLYLQFTIPGFDIYVCL